MDIFEQVSSLFQHSNATTMSSDTTVVKAQLSFLTLFIIAISNPKRTSYFSISKSSYWRTLDQSESS